jgi:hypothetical protein
VSYTEVETIAKEINEIKIRMIRPT